MSSGSLISYWFILDRNISDLFNNNNKTCQPACEIVQVGEYDLIKKCRIVVGYDDLLYKFGQNTVTIQKGRFWDFTCTRKLNGEAGDDGAVIGERENDNPKNETVETDFRLDLTCCDPADETCKEVDFLFL